MAKIEKTFLAIVVFLSFLLRFYSLPDTLLFHRDQGLHATAIWQIWHDKHPSLLGHPSDVDGLTHAPVYYLLMLPSYLLSGGDPAAAILFQIVLEVLTIPFLYLAIKQLFNRQTAVITLILYTFSYQLICYSRWLNNVPPILPFSHVLLYLVSLYKQSNKTTFLSSLIVGIITQLNAAVGVFLWPFIFWFYRSKSAKKWLLILTGLLLPALPLFVFEIRHQFVISSSITRFFGSSQGLSLPLITWVNNLKIFSSQLTKITSYPIPFIAQILFIIGLFFVSGLKSRKTIYAYLLTHFIFLGFFKRGAIEFFFISQLPISLALVSFGITKIGGKLKYVPIILLVALNVSNLNKVYLPANALIPIGNANIITLDDRKNIIDWIYKDANGQPFALWIYTIPYYQEEVWTYLFNWYGLKKYGYLPERYGSFSPSELKQSAIIYTIYEPDKDNPQKQKTWFEESDINFEKTKEEYQSRDLFVKKYLIPNNLSRK